MRRLSVVILLVLISGVVAWVLRDLEQAGRRARSDADLEVGVQKGGRGGDDDAPAPPPSNEAAVIMGEVTGPSGAQWGLRVLVFEPGKTSPFDEVATDTKGHYRLALACSPEGEEIDLAVHPALDSALIGERIEGVRIERGIEVRRDFHLSVGDPVGGRVALVSGAPLDRPVIVLAIPEERWDAAGGDPDPSAYVHALSTRADPEFRFPKLPPGRLVFISGTPQYVVLDPPRGEARDAPFELRLTRVERATIHVWDAETMRPVSGVRASLDGYPRGARLAAADIPPLGATVRLRWDGFWRRRARTLRISAPGYLDYVRGGPPNPTSGVQVYSVGLVSKRDANLIVRLRGDGAAGFAIDGALTGASVLDPAKPATEVRVVRFPILNRAPAMLIAAAPIRTWQLGFDAEMFRWSPAHPAPIDMPDQGALSVEFELPAPATVTIDWSALGGVQSAHLSVSGRPLRWVKAKDGVRRLVQSDDDRVQRWVWLIEPSKTVLKLLPGEWTVAWSVSVDGSKKAIVGARPTTLSEGQVLKITPQR